MALLLKDVPGYQEALRAARAREARTREDAFLELTHTAGPKSDPGAFQLRAMTVRDYVLLDRLGSPFVDRLAPTLAQLGLFLWVMSPQFGRWSAGRGWRRCVPWLQPLHAYLFARRVRRRLGFRALERLAREHYARSEEPFEVPDDSATAETIAACFEYIGKMFFDRPPAMAGGRDSGMCYLAHWSHLIRSTYNCTREEFWETTLPQLFHILKELRRQDSDVPSFNRHTDELNRQVQAALAAGMTPQELLAGKLKFHLN